MIKNTLSVIIFIFSISFFYFLGKLYFSESQKNKINKNRETISQKINNNISELPVLTNDTNDVIEFNSGFKSENNKVKRNFWKLFIKND